MLRGGIGYGGKGGGGGECIKQGAADRIERASASSPLIGSDVKRRILQKMYFFSTESVFLQYGKYIYSTLKIYFFNTD